jgi:hypothetical protein
MKEEVLTLIVTRPQSRQAELTTPGSSRVDDDVGWHGASLFLKQVENFRTKVNIQSYSSE